MKTPLSLILIGSIAVAATNIGFIWAIVEFILYASKDKPFNIWSLIVMIIGIVVTFVVMVFVYKVRSENRKKNLKSW